MLLAILFFYSYDDGNEVNWIGDGFRVVTLDGTLFEKNQCITGGGDWKGGAMKNEFRKWKSEMPKENIEKLKQQIMDNWVKVQAMDAEIWNIKY